MTTRRGFLVSALAAGLMPKPSWADVGNPAYVAAALVPDGSFHLFGLDAQGAEVFHVPLPGRGHAAAAHPHRPEAVAFARRPGTFAIVVDCSTGKIRATLDAPVGRHFYGHGAFSADGTRLFTTENDYDAGEGRIGVWDVADGYRRIGEFASGGVGPHEILLMPDSDTLVIANGGIETHPDSGRVKLNLPMMRPNLSYVATTGALLEMVEREPEQHMYSIRHLALSDDGLVAFAMQWEGDGPAYHPLLALHRQGGEVQLLRAPEQEHLDMQGYGASVAFSGDGSLVAITSSRGGQVQVFDAVSGEYLASHYADDLSGVGRADDGFLLTAGTGVVSRLTGAKFSPVRQFGRNWDNHLVRI